MLAWRGPAVVSKRSKISLFFRLRRTVFEIWQFKVFVMYCQWGFLTLNPAVQRRYWSNRLEKIYHPAWLPKDCVKFQIDYVKTEWEIDAQKTPVINNNNNNKYNNNNNNNNNNRRRRRRRKYFLEKHDFGRGTSKLIIYKSSGTDLRQLTRWRHLSSATQSLDGAITTWTDYVPDWHCQVLRKDTIFFARWRVIHIPVSTKHLYNMYTK